MGKLFVVFSVLILHVHAGEDLTVSQKRVFDAQTELLLSDNQSQNVAVNTQKLLSQLSSDILDTRKDINYLIETYQVFFNEQPNVAKTLFTEDQLSGFITFIYKEFNDIFNELDKLQRYQLYLGICGSLISVAEMISLYYLTDGNLVIAVGSIIGIIFPALEISKNISIDQYALGYKKKKVILPLFNDFDIDKGEKSLSISTMIHVVTQYQALIKHFNPQD